MEEATRMLNADRATLFLNDEKTNELFSRVAMGEGIGEIRLTKHCWNCWKCFFIRKNNEYSVCVC